MFIAWALQRNSTRVLYPLECFHEENRSSRLLKADRALCDSVRWNIRDFLRPQESYDCSSTCYNNASTTAAIIPVE